MMACCVPGCINLLSEWTTELPRDETLLARWKIAIQAGTGQQMGGDIQAGAMVCDMHFVAHHADGDQNEYREPTLFIRDLMLLRVVSCRLCLRYETIDTMYDKKHCFDQSNTLQTMVSKYFSMLKTSKERDDEGYFCEACVIRIDMTHAFWQEISECAKEHKKILRKMTKEKVVFRNTGPSSAGATPMVSIKVEPGTSDLNNQNLSQEQNTDDNFAQDQNASYSIVFKEEPQSTEHNSPSSPGVQESVPKEPATTTSVDSTQTSANPEVTLKEVPTESLKKHSCETCGKTYNRKSALTSHINTQHKAAPLSPEIHSTNQRNEKSKKRKLTDHDGTNSRKTEGPKPPSLPNEVTVVSIVGGKHKKRTRCNLCLQTFEQSKDTVTHFQEIHPETELKYRPCDDCDEVFFKRGNFINHRYTHTDTYACEQCGKRHYSISRLVQHRHTAHGAPLQEEHFVACPVCDRHVMRGASYFRHLRTHDEEKPYSCEFCGKSFRESPALELHRRIHTGEKPHGCDMCELFFREPNQLRIHRRTHTGEKPFSCDFCDKSYRSPAQLRVHRRTHTGEKPSVCSHCGERFAYSSMLARHKKRCASNTGEFQLV